MNYDSGIPAEDITEYLLKVKKKKEGNKKIEKSFGLLKALEQLQFWKRTNPKISNWN
ncbi:hypothetical protein RHORCCE3_2147 [Rickettsia hoogstraalii str. RCCE3]|nr:hypothetical protein RHORCCE3_2147 [Rickettsia hoogstraalii str. RCCE3]